MLLVLGTVAVLAATSNSALTAPDRAVSSIDVAAQKDMARWIRDFRDRAIRRGVSRSVFDEAFANVKYNEGVVRRDRDQAEFTKSIWDYLDTAVSEKRIEGGRAALRRYSDTLAKIEARYGVDKEILVAFWGIESNYGSHRGNFPLIESLATLAFDGRRARFFEEQLIAALKILQAGDVDPPNMVGSWAGATGHTQFMPDTFLAHAVDFNKDGRRNIWSDDPTDALASTASLIAGAGWQEGAAWGMEVNLPQGFDFNLIGRRKQFSTSFWAKMGVHRLDGRELPQAKGSIILPGGADGAAFIVFNNFYAIRRYNPADSYAIAVAHLADRLKGLGPIQRIPEFRSRALTQAERLELQERLTTKGFSTRGIDGNVGPNTVEAIRAFQRSAGIVPDGFPSEGLLQRLR
ncbi:lytic murein transglycosylase [Agrobacterium tumefaciens]|uniref:lytic murein transglycosylase n=1 Tax=Agrobacterium tumefaciens TaxID=358 RepID=UPI002243519A|nr:lytic murein transglycosylase [Agrobacterium tumefaciens]MCW8060092.1 lytic murein transglycosylase [Agrobacterium tumefaciens]